MNSTPWECKGKGCGESPRFNLTAVATEIGKGHKERRVLRLRVGHYCERCLRRGEFRFQGKDLPAGKGRGSDGR